MARPVVGIYATIAAASWGPWRDRPSALVPAALALAVQQAGGVVVLLAPDSDLECIELLRTLDALIVSDDALQLAALREAAREAGLPMLAISTARVTPESAAEDYARVIAPLFDGG